ncbi:MAG: hypothetical protein Fur0018_05310 [Anaerolineales bacterium]
MQVTPTPGVTRPPTRERVPTIPPARTVTPQASATPRVSASDLQGQQVQVWHTLPEVWLRGATAQFNRENPWGVTVSLHTFPDEAALREALPDAPPGTLLLTSPALTPLWEQSGALSDWQSWIDDPQYGLPAAEQMDFLPVFWREGLQGARRLALPFMRSAAFLVRNHTWAAELGKAAIPQTLADFQQQACAANAVMRQDDSVDNDGLGGWLVDTRPPVMLGWLYAFGAEPLHNKTYHFNTPEGEAAFTFLKALYDQNCAWVGNEDYPDDYLSTRRALFAALTLPEEPFVRQAFIEAGNHDQWGALPFPAPQGEPVLPTFGESFALTSGETPPQALAAWLYVRWMLSPEVQAQVTRQSNLLPVRRSALTVLADYGATHPVWQAVVDALPYARPEPALPSWNLVQWMLADAGEQIFRAYFEAGHVPDTLQLLDSSANEQP